MISSLARIVMRYLAVRASAIQLIAPPMVALLLLSPFTPLAPVVIAPAKADKVQDCLNSIGAAADLAKTLAQDLPGLTECSGQIAGGDLVMAAITIIIAGYAAANGGSFGGGDQVGACKTAVDSTLVSAIVDGLKGISAGGGASAVDALFGGADNANKVFAALANGGASALANLPGVSEVLTEAHCGCSIVAGALDIAKATADLGQDAAACSEVLFDFAADAGKVIASGFYALGEYVECGLNPGACSAGDGTRENIVYGQCHAGPVELTLHIEYDVDQVHGTVEHDYQSFDCDCPQGTHQQNLPKNTMACVCNDKTLAYDGSTCSSCPAATGDTGNAPGPDGTCQPWVCSTAGTNIPDGAKGTPGTSLGECTFSSGCDDGSVLVNGSCQMCAENQRALKGYPTKINVVTGVIEYAPDPNEPTGGKCVNCSFGYISSPGSTACTQVQCSLDQQLTADGTACGPCQNKVGKRQDAEVCLKADGTPLYPASQQCDWGSTYMVGTRNYGGSVYNTADCTPLHCRGTDHPDADGHACETCQSIAYMPVGLFGAAAGNFKTTPMSGGVTKMEFANGVQVSLGAVEEKGGVKSVKATSSGGKTQTVSAGGGAKEKTIAVCLDGVLPQGDVPYWPKNGLGVQVYQQTPEQKMEIYKPRPALTGNLLGNLLGNNGTPGGDPGKIIPNPATGFTGNAAATGMPTAMPGRQPTPPPPGGGTGHTDPAEGDKGNSRTAPAEGDKSYTAVPVLAKPDTPTSTGPGRTKGKDDGKTSGAPDGGYKSFTLKGEDADTSAPTSTGPGRNPRGKDKGSFTSHTDPAKGDGTNGNVYKYDKDDPSLKSHDPGSSNGTPQPHPTPGLNNGPELRATPRLNEGPMRETPRLNDGPNLRASPSLNDSPSLRATPRLNDGPLLRTTPSLNNTPRATIQATPPPTTRAPPPSGNTTPPERIPPMLNDSRSGPTLNSGTGAPSNPFAR